MSSAPTLQFQVESYLDNSSERSLAQDVFTGLSLPLKELPPKHLYDSRGSELFDKICELEEYYPTRTERALLETFATEIIEKTQSKELIELGSGAAEKSLKLLDAMARQNLLQRYVPLDVCESMVRATEQLTESYTALQVHGIIADFERHLDCIPSGSNRLVALLGGTIGNFTFDARHNLLKNISAFLEPNDYFLLGTGLVTDITRMETAYNDKEGITAEFNLNMLHVLNRELGADFDLDNFIHVAFFDQENEWIEMRLRARNACSVNIAQLNLSIDFEENEDLRTEVSAKFTRKRLEEEYEAANLELCGWYPDTENLFAISLARRKS